MRQKFVISGEFLLPEGFSGGFKEALALYVKDCKENMGKQVIKLPATLPDALCFPFIVDSGGVNYTTFSIEDFPFDDLGEELELDEARSEAEMENVECLDLNQ